MGKLHNSPFRSELSNQGANYKFWKAHFNAKPQVSSRNWHVISSEGVAVFNDVIYTMLPRDSVDIAIVVKHRTTTRSSGELVLIGVQTSASFSEKDMIRYENDFERVPQ